MEAPPLPLVKFVSIKEAKEEEEGDPSLPKPKVLKEITSLKNKIKPGVSIGKAPRPIDMAAKFVTPGPTSYESLQVKKSYPMMFPKGNRH